MVCRSSELEEEDLRSWRSRRQKQGCSLNDGLYIQLGLLALQGRRRDQRVEVVVDEGEPSELLLVDGLDDVRVDGRERRLLFGELGVEVHGVLAALLQGWQRRA